MTKRVCGLCLFSLSEVSSYISEGVVASTRGDVESSIVRMYLVRDVRVFLPIGLGLVDE